ncbi:RNA polymerase Rpb4-domain-containing protein [Stachybotrys elegans]|uniref:DNA-directed RNA polymerase III subunit RPC9 n=1 Tax=Stachybotrys elegans TaxID=80388 RepID=A0A8K0SR21_9HYPO|nr:RNA polymerase Rpb4-domain-containing protein [Stachybotrys elegans]
MKVIESQSAVLTNYEVYQHVIDQRAAKENRKKENRRGPPNLETAIRELLKYLTTEPSPLSQKPITYTPDCIPRLLERLSPYDLPKGEVVMILNLRPVSIPALNTVIEDMGERFTEEQQEDILNSIAEVLGQPPSAEGGQNGAEASGDEDEAMKDVNGS